MKAKFFSILALASFIALGHLSPATAGANDYLEKERLQSLEKAQANLAILAFKKTKPAVVFEQVRYTMADAIEVNSSLSLQQAYAVAVYFHYDITASNYQKFGISTDDYTWLMRSRNGSQGDGSSGDPALFH